jgi:hypothetical protein
MTQNIAHALAFTQMAGLTSVKNIRKLPWKTVKTLKVDTPKHVYVAGIDYPVTRQQRRRTEQKQHGWRAFRRTKEYHFWREADALTANEVAA